MSDNIDTVKPEGSWVFDEEVAGCFDDMLARSIPQYEVMRKTCLDVARIFVTPKTDIVDLGCSCGGAIEPLLKAFGAQNRYIGVEVSEPMRQAAIERFSDWIKNEIVDIRDIDLRTDYPTGIASVVLSVLTLQFIPIEYRQRLVKEIYDNLYQGGALILVEKVLGETFESNEILVQQYYQFKHANGYSYDDIERKRHSLEGVLVPVTAKWNEDILWRAGFRHVECFWRWMNFAGWVAVKG